MGLLDLFGKRDVSDELTKKIPFTLKVSFHPVRLSANRQDSNQLLIDVKNLTREPLLTSLVVKCSKHLGLDSMGISKEREIRLGELPSGDSKHLQVDLFSSTNTDAGTYPVHVTAISHYRNYAYVLNSETKKMTVRVV